MWVSQLHEEYGHHVSSVPAQYAPQMTETAAQFDHTPSHGGLDCTLSLLLQDLNDSVYEDLSELAASLRTRYAARDAEQNKAEQRAQRQRKFRSNRELVMSTEVAYKAYLFGKICVLSGYSAEAKRCPGRGDARLVHATLFEDFELHCLQRDVLRHILVKWGMHMNTCLFCGFMCSDVMKFYKSVRDVVPDTQPVDMEHQDLPAAPIPAGWVDDTLMSMAELDVLFAEQEDEPHSRATDGSSTKLLKCLPPTWVDTPEFVPLRDRTQPRSEYGNPLSARLARHDDASHDLSTSAHQDASYEDFFGEIIIADDWQGDLIGEDNASSSNFGNHPTADLEDNGCDTRFETVRRSGDNAAGTGQSQDEDGDDTAEPPSPTPSPSIPDDTLLAPDNQNGNSILPGSLQMASGRDPQSQGSMPDFMDLLMNCFDQEMGVSDLQELADGGNMTIGPTSIFPTDDGDIVRQGLLASDSVNQNFTTELLAQFDVLDQGNPYQIDGGLTQTSEQDLPTAEQDVSMQDRDYGDFTFNAPAADHDISMQDSDHSSIAPDNEPQLPAMISYGIRMQDHASDSSSDSDDIELETSSVRAMKNARPRGNSGGVRQNDIHHNVNVAGGAQLSMTLASNGDARNNQFLQMVLDQPGGSNSLSAQQNPQAEVNEQLPAVCDVCERSFDHPANVEKHVRNVHGPQLLPTLTYAELHNQQKDAIPAPPTVLKFSLANTPTSTPVAPKSGSTIAPSSKAREVTVVIKRNPLAVNTPSLTPSSTKPTPTAAAASEVNESIAVVKRNPPTANTPTAAATPSQRTPNTAPPGSGKKTYLCNWCGEVMSSLKIVKQHLTNCTKRGTVQGPLHVHPDVQIDVDGKFSLVDMNAITDNTYKCTPCGSFFKTQLNLKRHLDQKCHTLRAYGYYEIVAPACGRLRSTSGSVMFQPQKQAQNSGRKPFAANANNELPVSSNFWESARLSKANGRKRILSGVSVEDNELGRMNNKKTLAPEPSTTHSLKEVSLSKRMRPEYSEDTEPTEPNELEARAFYSAPNQTHQQLQPKFSAHDTTHRTPKMPDTKDLDIRKGAKERDSLAESPTLSIRRNSNLHRAAGAAPQTPGPLGQVPVIIDGEIERVLSSKKPQSANRQLDFGSSHGSSASAKHVQRTNTGTAEVASLPVPATDTPSAASRDRWRGTSRGGGRRGNTTTVQRGRGRGRTITRTCSKPASGDTPPFPHNIRSAGMNYDSAAVENFRQPTPVHTRVMATANAQHTARRRSLRSSLSSESEVALGTAQPAETLSQPPVVKRGPGRPRKVKSNANGDLSQTLAGAGTEDNVDKSTGGHSAMGIQASAGRKTTATRHPFVPGLAEVNEQGDPGVDNEDEDDEGDASADQRNGVKIAGSSQ
jgi:hypothetical protein